MPPLPATEPAVEPQDDAAGDEIVYSVVIPVYGNEATLGAVVERLTAVAAGLPGRLEAVFVVDGSPDGSELVLRRLLPEARIPSRLVVHSRNFGSFAAIRTGLAAARGRYVGVMAADLQEPPELMAEFFARLATGEVDVVVGRRVARADPGASAFASSTFWRLYRRLVNPQIPPGGVDVFGCTREVAGHLVAMQEAHTSLVGQLFWVGYRRGEVPYARLERTEGKSGWTLRKRVRYLLDSVFSFTDIPISVLTSTGVVGAALTVLAAIVVGVSRLTGHITAVGYTPLMLVVLLSTFTLLFGLGVVGSYVWRTFENSKGRPTAIAMAHETYDGRG